MSKKKKILQKTLVNYVDINSTAGWKLEVYLLRGKCHAVNAY